MKQYLDLLSHVMEHGTDKSDRTGTGTKSVFGYQMHFNLEDGFPLLTTKKLHTRSIFHELLWFIRGETNIKYLKDNGLATDADKTRFSKYRQIVNTIVGASSVTGVVMLLFALLVFSLFIQLTIASTRHEINLLITLGASPDQLQKFLMKQFLPLNIIIVFVCLFVVAVGQFTIFFFEKSAYVY